MMYVFKKTFLRNPIVKEFWKSVYICQHTDIIRLWYVILTDEQQ